MRPFLADLISRMSATETPAGSEDSASWHAYREAEGLADRTMLAELAAFLGSNPPVEQRKAACIMIGRIGRNLQDPDATSILLPLVSREKDKHALASLLGSLAELPKPANLDLQPIYERLGDRRWLVRHAAIRALDKAVATEAEERLLSLVAASSDPGDLIHGHATLGRIGTERSLPQLEQGLQSRKRDVKLSARTAIDAIRERAAAPKTGLADADSELGRETDKGP